MKIFLKNTFDYVETIGELDGNKKGNYMGVYIIVRPEGLTNIQFEERSKAFKFRGKDPTVSVDRLKKEWVDEAEILYIGKSQKSVRKRMQEHTAFWDGKKAVAWGGRLIAQIQNFKDLEVWYLQDNDPKTKESELIKEFKNKYKKIPFANLRR